MICLGVGEIGEWLQWGIIIVMTSLQTPLQESFLNSIPMADISEWEGDRSSHAGNCFVFDKLC